MIDDASTFDRATIEAIRDGLTMLDIYRARKITKEAVEVGLVAYHLAGMRLGIVAEGTTLEAFLGRLRADDFNEIMGAAREVPDPLSSGGGTGPPLSDSTD